MNKILTKNMESILCVALECPIKDYHEIVNKIIRI